MQEKYNIEIYLEPGEAIALNAGYLYTTVLDTLQNHDTSIAILAGFMIIPAVYVFSGEEGLATGGPGLMFMTLPKVFDSMPMGNIIGAAFFILVFFAALTSSISIMEAIASNLMQKLGNCIRSARVFSGDT